jgi:hypothetical protein
LLIIKPSNETRPDIRATRMVAEAATIAVVVAAVGSSAKASMDVVTS